MRLGEVAANARRLDQAIVHYERAVEARPSRAARLTLAKALLALDRLDEAIAHFQVLMEPGKKSAQVYYYFGRARDKNGETETAQGLYRQALEMAKGSGDQSFIRTIENQLR